MIKKTDKEILSFQEKIKLKKEKIESLKSKFSPKTKCSYKRFEKDEPKNLHIQNNESLIKILSYLIQDYDSFIKANEIVINNLKDIEYVEFIHQGHSFDDWKSDIISLVDRNNLKKLEKDLNNDIESLNDLLSLETKSVIKFNNIKNKYK